MKQAHQHATNWQNDITPKQDEILLKRKEYNDQQRARRCGQLAAQHFEMRYCKCCLKKKLEGVELHRMDEYIGLKLPVIDDWGIVYLATIAVMAEDMAHLIASPQSTVDLSDYAILLQLEDMRDSSIVH